MAKKTSPDHVEAPDGGTGLPNSGPGFESRLARLETISELMRSSEVGLEEASALFEEGIALARGLEKDLARVERRIEILVNEPTSPGEKPVLELFPELEGQ